MPNDFYRRIARMEAMINTQRAELTETLQAAYERACEERNEEDAATLARKLRDKLLDMSDKEMSLDRLGLDTSSTAKFIASLTNIFKGKWAEYRQALRDLPQQDGFPFNVKFPVSPDEKEMEE